MMDFMQYSILFHNFVNWVFWVSLLQIVISLAMLILFLKEVNKEDK
jgi:ABC-type multidrug transport system permease subunit